MSRHIVSRLIATAVGVMFAVWGGEMLIDAWDYPMAGAPLPQGVVFFEQMFAPRPAAPVTE
jgi:hypothetical protein